MFKISKRHFIIFIFIVIKRCNGTQEGFYTDLLERKEPSNMYIKRMTNLGLPYLGQSYSEYEQTMSDEDKTPVSLEEYQIIMDSYPRIYELRESVNKRNEAKTTKDGKKIYLQSYVLNVFNHFRERYPLLHETYKEYLDRMSYVDLDDEESSSDEDDEIEDPLKYCFTEKMFDGLKNFFPIIGETYEEYIERQNTYGTKGFGVEEYLSFINLIPRPEENDLDYLLRANKEESTNKTWRDMSRTDYGDLRSLLPQHGETHTEYKKRMDSFCLLSMSLDIFIMYQNYYPHLSEQYVEYQLRIQSKIFPKGDLKAEKRNLHYPYEEVFNSLKLRIPLPYESLVNYEKRLTEKNHCLTSENEFYTIKRIWPNMHETYEEYCIRVEDYYTTPISSKLFFDFKQNYPQIGFKDKPMYRKNKYSVASSSTTPPLSSYVPYRQILTGESIQASILENVQLDPDTMYWIKRNEILLERPDYTILGKRLPSPYEFYELYENNLMIPGRQGARRKPKSDKHPVTEDEFEDLKKVYMMSSETYEVYTSRMSIYGIRPMSEENVYYFKIVFPREIETTYQEYCDHMNAVFDAIRENDNYASLKVLEPFGKKLFDLFQKAYPRPFELYSLYKKRIKDLAYNDEIFYLKPYNQYEFVDLKLRYPWLSESKSRYEKRLQTYGLNRVVSSDQFKIYKNAHPAIDENFTSYKTRMDILTNAEENDEFDGGFTEDTLENYRIVPMNKSLFLRFKSNWPSAFETSYMDYCIRSRPYAFDAHEFNDLKKLYPGYCEKFDEYNNNMDDWHLTPVSREFFDSFKFTYPSLNDYNYEVYSKRVESKTATSSIDSDDETKTKKEEEKVEERKKEEKDDLSLKQKMKQPMVEEEDSSQAKKIESYDLPPMSEIEEIGEVSSSQQQPESYDFPKMTQTEYNRFKSKMPKQFEGVASYSFRLTGNPTPSNSRKWEYTRLVKVYPIISLDYDAYEAYIKNSLSLIPISIVEYKSYKMHIPERNDENYNIYKQRVNSHRPNLHESLARLGLSPFTEQEFNRFKSKSPSPFERYANYEKRMKLKNKNYFLEFEFHDISTLISTLHGTYLDHIQRMAKIFRQPMSRKEFKAQNSSHVLLGESFLEHKNKLKNIYPKSPNETDLEYFSRIKNDGIETIDETNFIEHMLLYPFNYETIDMYISRRIDTWTQHAFLENWFRLMKKFLPKMCESLNEYNKRVEDYYFPPMTDIQFKRFMYELPIPAESSDNFLTRLKPSIGQRTAKDFMCPTYTQRLNPYLTTIANSLINISPKFMEDYSDYKKRIKEKKKGTIPLSLAEFQCFKYCLPIVDETHDSYNKRMKSIDFEESTFENFSRLKFFYPRKHHILYDNYLFDIGQVFIYSESVMDIVDSQQLTENEFNKFRNILPNQLDILHDRYKKRMAKNNHTVILELNIFNSFKNANFPLADEEYNQHVERLASLGLKCIPEDVFYFFKAIYPFIFDEIYPYRTKIEEVEKLKLPTEKTYIGGNLPIVKEIELRRLPYTEHNKKMELLSNEPLEEEELNDFMNILPRVFEPYSHYVEKMKANDSNDMLGEKEYYSLKKAYYPQVHENYEEYTRRMNALGLSSLEKILFYYCKEIYPHPHDSYEDYQTRVTNLEKISFINQPYKQTNLMNLGFKLLSADEFTAYKNDIPKVFRSYVDHNKIKKQSNVEAEGSTTNYFTEEEFEILKKAYYPKLTENYTQFYDRMLSSGIRTYTENEFLFFKEIFPSLFEKLFKNYQARVDNNVKNAQKLSWMTNERLQHIQMNALNENEFHQFWKTSPRLLETYDFYLKKVNNQEEASEPTREKLIFSKELFQDLKKVYLPTLGKTLDSYVTYLKKLELHYGEEQYEKDIKIYFRNLILLYPQFHESYEAYCDRNVQSKLTNLMMSYNEYDLFMTILPRPYESYGVYSTRLIALSESLETKFSNYGKTEEFILSNEEFDSWRLVYPRLMENYHIYSTRMSFYGIIPVNVNIYMYFKQLYPQIDETYIDYVNRITKKYFPTTNQSQIVGNKIRTIQGESSTPVDQSIQNLKTVAEITIMTQSDFKSFKRSLPAPKENYEQYKKRIEKMTSESRGRIIAIPHPLPIELFNDILNAYPPAENECLHNGTLKLSGLAVMEENTIHRFEDFYRPLMSTSREPTQKLTPEKLLDEVRTIV